MSYRANIGFFVAIVSVWGLLSSWALAQLQAPVSQTSAAQSPAPAAVVQAPKGLFLEGVTTAVFSRARRGRPLTISAVARNSGSTPRSAVAVAKINSAPDLQAAHFILVPPGEKRSVELRLHVPDSVTGGAIEFTVSLNDPNNPDQVLTGPDNLPLVDTRRVNLNQDWLITALAMKTPPKPMPDWYWPQDDVSMDYEFVVAARADSSNSRRTLTIDHENLPTLAADWQGIDEIVINSNRPFEDPAVIASMNRWIAGGGRAWVMFDEIKPENLRLMLPDGMSCEQLDDIDLNRFVIEPTVFNQLAEADRTVVSERPTKLRRVTQIGGSVSHSIDGYPAAIWYRVGKGLLLVTTLGPEGWLEPRTSQRKNGEEFETRFQLRPWAVTIADRLHEKRQMTAPIENVEVQYPLQQIGNPVLNRSYVLAMVFGFCIVLCVAASACRWFNFTIQLAWLIPTLSLLATLPLLISSMALRRELPDTSAHLQLIEVQPGSRTVQALQWTASYLADSKDAKLQADGDAAVWWQRSEQQLDLRRWNWQDYGRWELSSTGWPAGVWQINARYALPSRDLDVVGNIDDSGLRLRMPAGLEMNLEDSVVQYWPGDPVPNGTIAKNSETKVSEAQLSQDESWLTGSLITDEQLRREQVYRQLQAKASDVGYPSYPALMGWTDLWPRPIQWNESRNERGAALVVLPIKLQPTPSGQRVHVPHTVVHVENSSSGGGVSTMFSNASGWWRGATTLAATIRLRCTLPKQVCPLKAEQVTCEIQMRAPQRKVSLKAFTGDDKPRLVKEMVSPTASQAISIVDAEILDEIRDGVLELQVEIGPEITKNESPFGDQQAEWQVDYFRLSVDGSVEER